MSYPTIFDPIPWPLVGFSFLQAIVLYWLVMLGLKLVGRRTFSGLGTQEMILLLILSEATDVGVTHMESGFWGSVASIVALLLTVYIVDRIDPLRERLEGKPIYLMRDGKLDEPLMKKYRIDKSDLEHTARKYGVPFHAFECLVLEGDGNLTGLIRQSFYRLTAD